MLDANVAFFYRSMELYQVYLVSFLFLSIIISQQQKNKCWLKQYFLWLQLVTTQFPSLPAPLSEIAVGAMTFILSVSFRSLYYTTFRQWLSNNLNGLLKKKIGIEKEEEKDRLSLLEVIHFVQNLP